MNRFLQFAVLIFASLLLACSSQPAAVEGAQKTPDKSGFVASATRSIVAVFFDMPPPGTPDPGTTAVVRLRRRVLFIDPGIEEMKKAIAAAQERANAPPPANWAEMFKRLPKDDEDNLDWMAALKDKIITPATAIDPATAKPGPKPMDLDVEISTSGKPDRMVVFPHKSHTQWLVCDNCHPAIFEQEAGAAKITMEAINSGKFCGVCHDAVATALPSGCLGCHKAKVAAK